MKTTFKKLLLVLFCAISLNTFAQKPEPVYSFVRVSKDLEWYKQQAKAWKLEIDNGTIDKMAWVNFYRANRAVSRYYGKKTEKNQTDYLLPLNEIVKMAEKAIPNTFELYFIQAYDNSSLTETGQKYLMKAQAIKPFDKIIFPDLMNYFQVKRDQKNIDILSQKWFENNEIPEGILAANYNVLMSLDKNAILLVNGDNTTYPVWVLQQAKQIRKDVLLLNISLLINKEYRDAIFKENAIPELNKLELEDKSMSMIVKHIIENVKNRPIYASIHMDDNVYKDYTDKMYLVGLAFKYSEKPFNNMAVLQNNFENKFLLDYLKVNFTDNYAQSVVDQMNLSYLAVFLKIYEQYQLCGETVKAQKVKELAKTVSADSSVGTEWLKYFEK